MMVDGLDFWILTKLQVYVVGIPLTSARQMLKNWQSPPIGSASRALQRAAQASTSYLSMKENPMYY